MVFARPSRAVTAAVLAVLGPLLAGCYTYQPVENPAPGTPVRALIPVRSALQGSHEAPETFAVEGTVLSSGDTLVLETATRAEIGAFREIRQVDTLKAAARDLAGLDAKIFSTQRSVGLGLLLTGGVAGLVVAVTGLGGGGGGVEPEDGGTQGAVVLSPVVSALFKLLGR